MGLVETLVLGSYVFTAWVYRSLKSKFDNLLGNHIKHIEERLDKLEQK